MPRRMEIRIAGIGGQGAVLAGQILGRAAMYEGNHVVQTQSYGAEARGSAAKSEIIISDQKIGFPIVRHCDILVAMDQTALDQHLKELKKNGILIIDEDLVKNVSEAEFTLFKIRATKAAEDEFRSRVYTNVVMLGALIGATGIVGEGAVERAIVESVSKAESNNNLQGFKLGLKLIKAEI